MLFVCVLNVYYCSYITHSWSDKECSANADGVAGLYRESVGGKDECAKSKEYYLLYSV